MASFRFIFADIFECDSLAEYLDEKPIKIIRQDDIAHIIRYKDDNVIAANIWQQQKVELTRHISAIGKMAILVQKEEGTKRISVSDPLQNQTTVELEFKKPIKIMSDPDQRLQISGQKILTIDVTNLKGNSYQFIVK
ncbi:polysaccharide lyase beta-sandwich domain-containing protein [Photobacterium damselae]|uniref:polysaccharide lyase beta-sandwich domain-containing protein n=1 Tax=Photobacterium damselae TaxID=38293 RepID=UPI0020CC6B83|nr:polysaccharide lyase beta-sandwich domain-containing protein [Photobacterium damselae]